MSSTGRNSEPGSSWVPLAEWCRASGMLLLNDSKMALLCAAASFVRVNLNVGRVNGAYCLWRMVVITCTWRAYVSDRAESADRCHVDGDGYV